MYGRMRKTMLAVAFTALPFVFHGVWRRLLSHAVFPFLSNLSASAPFPVFMPVILLFLLLGRKKYFLRRFLSALLILLVLWLPLYMPFSAEETEVSEEALLALIENTVSEISSLNFSPLPHSDIALLSQNAVSDLFPELPTGAVPKFTKNGEIMRKFDVAGIFIPLTGEAVISPTEPEKSLPFLACHELCHRMGIADEGSANLAAFLACIVSENESFRYSAHLHLLRYSMILLNDKNPAKALSVHHELPGGIASDLSMLGVWKTKREDEASPLAFMGNYSDMVPLLISMIQTNSAFAPFSVSDEIINLIGRFAPLPSDPTA